MTHVTWVWAYGPWTMDSIVIKTSPPSSAEKYLQMTLYEWNNSKVAFWSFFSDNSESHIGTVRSGVSRNLFKIKMRDPLFYFTLALWTKERLKQDLNKR